MTHKMTHRNFLLLTIALLLTSCTTERITCWSDKTGEITYMGKFDDENKFNYVVNVADGVRDIYPKQNCQPHELAEGKG